MDELTPSSAERLVRELAQATRSLEDYSPAEVDQVRAWFGLEEARRSLEHRAELDRFDLAQDIQDFLGTYSASKVTQRGFQNALDRYLGWCQTRHLHPAAASAVEAEEYLIWLSKQRSQAGPTAGDLLSSATKRSVIAAVHLWYNWLARRHWWIANPFNLRRGTIEALPRRDFVIPTAPEFDQVVDFLRDKRLAEEAAFLGVLRYCGLPISAAAVMIVAPEGAFETQTKGRKIVGRLPAEVVALLETAGLHTGCVFVARKPESWRQAVYRLMTDLVDRGVLKTLYSAHDFRHLFAIEHYRRHHDIAALRDCLGHSSVSATKLYLRGLGETQYH